MSLTTAPPRAPKRDFAALVKNAPPSPVALPLTHVTDGYSFRDIIARGALMPTPCDVFGESLLYLFYGRPAYRAAAELESNGSEAYWPVCFVLEPDAVDAKRIYPFDSGAFHHNRFSRFMYHRMIKEDFELDTNPETPGKLVRLFWQNERAYFDADGASSFAPSTFEFEAKAYRDLIADRGRAPFDERNSAVELQVDAQLDLPGKTIAVVLPYEFASVDMISKIAALGAIVLPFDVVRRHGPTEMVGQIYTIVRDLLSGKHAQGRVKCW
jgi:hypothetical protein